MRENNIVMIFREVIEISSQDDGKRRVLGFQIPVRFLEWW